MDSLSQRTELRAIAEAALAAVDPERLVRRWLSLDGTTPAGAGQPHGSLGRIDAGRRVAIVGGGKAAAAMAAGLVAMLTQRGLPASQLAGVVSVPEGSGRAIPGITVRETRPPGINLPTEQAVAASQEMRNIVADLGPEDIALAVISGGGSALLAAPRPGVPLAEKVAVAAFLAAAGADIRDLNAVRRMASSIKGGGLARSCAAGRMAVLVLSDVIGDPLEFIASGPCLPGGDAAAALAVLERFGAVAAGVAPGLVAVLEDDLRRESALPGAADSGHNQLAASGSWTTPRGCQVEHVLLGGNDTAVDAAAAKARELGYAVTVRHAQAGTAETADEVGARLAQAGIRLAAETAADGHPRAIIEGGEAVVRLPARPGRGGRNQQTAIAAIAAALAAHGSWPPGLTLASLGTDGEDGPTSAAGGLVDAAVATAVVRDQLDLAAAVARCDAHPLLAAAGGLIETGPTGTNVADLRILLTREESPNASAAHLRE